MSHCNEGVYKDTAFVISTFVRVCVCVCVCVYVSSLRLKVPGKPSYMKSYGVEKERERIIKAGWKT